jgi:hypothetical protein
VDLVIHGGVVSGAASPWCAITKAPGMRSVTVIGGIIALGPGLPGEPRPPGGVPRPSWLHLIHDPDLETGKVFPPVVPNIIDVRILSFPLEAEPGATPAGSSSGSSAIPEGQPLPLIRPDLANTPGG